MSRSLLVIPLIVGGAQFMHQFDGAVIATALPSMAASLGQDPVRLNLAISIYLLALAVFVPVSGWMADRFGAKRVFVVAIVGHGAKHDATLRAYQDAATKNQAQDKFGKSHVKVVSFDSVTDADEIAADLVTLVM